MANSLSSDKNLHAERERMIVELLKGKQIATQLKTLMNQPVLLENHGEELAMQIFRSFTETLSMLNSCTGSTGSTRFGNGSDFSREGKKKVGVKDRRGCYKRRRTSDSWITVSPTMEDGSAWRKYGQKEILNSKFPRCYYRCTHKPQGCKATKQVQTIKEDPISYQTTYFNHHTCTHTLIRAPQLIAGSDPVEPNLICFQSKTQSQQDQYSPNPIINNISTLNNIESKIDTQSEDTVSDAKSTLDMWQEIIGLESWGYKPVWDPTMSSYQDEEGSGFQSCGSTSLHGLDMEVNQIGDIDHFHYFIDDL